MRSLAIVVAALLASSARPGDPMAPWIGHDRVSILDLVRLSLRCDCIPDGAWPEVDRVLERYRDAIASLEGPPGFGRLGSPGPKYASPEEARAATLTAVRFADAIIAEERRLWDGIANAAGADARGPLSLLRLDRAVGRVAWRRWESERAAWRRLLALEPLTEAERPDAMRRLIDGAARAARAHEDAFRAASAEGAMTGIPVDAEGRLDEAQVEAARAAAPRGPSHADLEATYVGVLDAAIGGLDPARRDEVEMTLFDPIVSDFQPNWPIRIVRELVPHIADIDESTRARVDAIFVDYDRARDEQRRERIATYRRAARAGEDANDAVQAMAKTPDGGWYVLEHLTVDQRTPSTAAWSALAPLFGDADRAALLEASRTPYLPSHLVARFGDDVAARLRDLVRGPHAAGIEDRPGADQRWLEPRPSEGAGPIGQPMRSTLESLAGDNDVLRRSIAAAIDAHARAWADEVEPLAETLGAALLRGRSAGRKQPSDANAEDPAAARITTVREAVEQRESIDQAIGRLDQRLFAQIREFMDTAPAGRDGAAIDIAEASRVAQVACALVPFGPRGTNDWLMGRFGDAIPQPPNLFACLEACSNDPVARAAALDLAHRTWPAWRKAILRRSEALGRRSTALAWLREHRSRDDGGAAARRAFDVIDPVTLEQEWMGLWRDVEGQLEAAIGADAVNRARSVAWASGVPMHEGTFASRAELLRALAGPLPVDDPRRDQFAVIEAELNDEWARVRSDAWQILTAAPVTSADPREVIAQLSANRERSVAALLSAAEEAWGRAMRDGIVLLGAPEREAVPALRTWLRW